MEVLDVRLEMRGEAVDALGEERYLHLGRTRVLARALILLDDLRLLRHLQCHACVSLSLSLRKIFEPAILTDARGRSQGFSMFFSRLGKPQRFQQAFALRFAEA